MISAPLPPDEEERLKCLEELKILDTEIDKNLDAITKLAAERRIARLSAEEKFSSLRRATLDNL
ncbi:MAG: hypothetical protein HRU09_09995 [Oligoflexales bacterium]|nr:hypothetical protein [Oligoflexales bacterium]